MIDSLWLYKRPPFSTEPMKNIFFLILKQIQCVYSQAFVLFCALCPLGLYSDQQQQAKNRAIHRTNTKRAPKQSVLVCTRAIYVCKCWLAVKKTKSPNWGRAGFYSAIKCNWTVVIFFEWFEKKGLFCLTSKRKISLSKDIEKDASELGLK